MTHVLYLRKVLCHRTETQIKLLKSSFVWSGLQSLMNQPQKKIYQPLLVLKTCGTTGTAKHRMNLVPTPPHLEFYLWLLPLTI